MEYYIGGTNAMDFLWCMHALWNFISWGFIPTKTDGNSVVNFHDLHFVEMNSMRVL